MKLNVDALLRHLANQIGVHNLTPATFANPPTLSPRHWSTSAKCHLLKLADVIAENNFPKENLRQKSSAAFLPQNRQRRFWNRTNRRVLRLQVRAPRMRGEFPATPRNSRCALRKVAHRLVACGENSCFAVRTGRVVDSRRIDSAE